MIYSYLKYDANIINKIFKNKCFYNIFFIAL